MNSRENCFGCGACAYICPTNAITMTRDTLGFLYPDINPNSCIHCNRCKNICPHPSQTSKTIPIYLVGRCKEEKELLRSQSGGAFYAISQEALQRGFVIYGAAFNDRFEVVHRRATTEEERDYLRGSKYVQSNISPIYADIISNLQNGKHVLFSGTPCQVAAIKAVTQKKKISKNLYTVDTVCHAAPSPGIWHDNLEQIRQYYKSEIIEAQFRDKRMRSKTYWETYVLANGRKIHRRSSNYLFTQHLSPRDSCFQCPFTTLNREGDITIGDLQSHEKYSNKYSDMKGVSSIIINTPKGNEFLKALYEVMELENVSKDIILQPQLQFPIKPNPRRREFIRDYEKRGFAYVVKKYGDQGIRYKCIFIRNKFHGLCKRIKKLLNLS